MHTFTTTEDDKGRVYFVVGYYAPPHNINFNAGVGESHTWTALRDCKTVGAALMWVNYLNGGALPDKAITATIDQISARWEHGT